MKKSYITIKNENHEEITINKSVFIGHLYPIKSVEDAKKNINDLKSKYSDANHNCSAYIIGNQNIQKFDDDGEPGGTAGMPIMQAITYKKIDDILLVVTRYFGGIKLGAGGLVRAYSKISSMVIDSATKIKMIPSFSAEILVDYQFQGKIEYFLRSNEIKIVDTIFTNDVKYMVETYMEFEKLKMKIIELTHGNGKIEKKDELYLAVELNEEEKI